MLEMPRRRVVLLLVLLLVVLVVVLLLLERGFRESGDKGGGVEQRMGMSRGGGVEWEERKGSVVIGMQVDSVCLRRWRVEPNNKFLIFDVWPPPLPPLPPTPPPPPPPPVAAAAVGSMTSWRLKMGDGMEALPTDLCLLRKKKLRKMEEGLWTEALLGESLLVLMVMFLGVVLVVVVATVAWKPLLLLLLLLSVVTLQLLVLL